MSPSQVLAPPRGSRRCPTAPRGDPRASLREPGRQAPTGPRPSHRGGAGQAGDTAGDTVRSAAAATAPREQPGPRAAPRPELSVSGRARPSGVRRRDHAQGHVTAAQPLAPPTWPVGAERGPARPAGSGAWRPRTEASRGRALVAEGLGSSRFQALLRLRRRLLAWRRRATGLALEPRAERRPGGRGLAWGRLRGWGARSTCCESPESLA